MPNGCEDCGLIAGWKRDKAGRGARKAIDTPTMPRLGDVGGLRVDCGWIALKNAPSPSTGRVGRVDWAQMPRVWHVGGLGRCVPVRGSGALYPNYNDMEYLFRAFDLKNHLLDFYTLVAPPTFLPARMLVGMRFLNVVQFLYMRLH